MRKTIALLLTTITIFSLLTGCNSKTQNDYFYKNYFNGQSYLVLEDGYKGKYKETFDGEYDVQNVKFEEETEYINRDEYNKNEIVTFEEYESYCQKWGLKQKYDDKNSNFVIISFLTTSPDTAKVKLVSVDFFQDSVTAYIDEDVTHLTDSMQTLLSLKGCEGYCLIIPVKEQINKLTTILVVSDEEYKEIAEIKEVIVDVPTVDKPIIYFYPEEKINIQVTLLNADIISHSYPKYKNQWNITANPDGTLIDNNTNRELYALYYECIPDKKASVQNEGFVIKGEDTIEFLEDKLSILGLTEKEAEEFIIYWLPKMENNKYIYIRFLSQKEINEIMPISFSENPDTFIRVWMQFKGLDNPISVNEQELINQERNGFTVVEWGGTEIK